MPWIKLKTIDRGYFDPKTGKKLLSIAGRMNRKGIDEFTHLGTDYPAMYFNKNITEHHELNGELLLNIDVPLEDLQTMAIVDDQFQTVILTDEEAIAIKKSVFGIFEPKESGVTP